MTNTSENKGQIELIVKYLVYLNKTKLITIPFLIFGLVLGIYTSPKEENILFMNKGIIECYVSSSENISIMLMELNNYDLKSKAEILKLPENIVSNLVEIRSTPHVIKESNDASREKQIVKFEIYYYKKQYYKSFIKSIENYINSSSYVKLKYQEYIQKRKIKSEVLKLVNNELNKIDQKNQLKTVIQDYAIQSNADLYRLKISIENDLIESAKRKIYIENGYRETIGSGNPKNILFHIVSFGIFGFIFSLLLIQLINFSKSIKNHLKLKNEL